MKIIFITAGPIGSAGDMPQLGLAYLCAFLKHHGYTHVEYYDTSVSPIKKLEEYFRREQPDFIGVSLYTPTRHDALKVIARARQLVPNAKIVAGGIHPTFLPEQMIEHYKEIDYVVTGEGEQITLELVNRLEKNEDVRTIPGICYRNEEGKAVRVTGHLPSPDLDTLPFPEYFEHYTLVNGKKLKAGSMITSRGCAAACNFCTVPAFWGRQRLRSPGSVIAEMKWLVETHGVEYIWIMDDTFTIEMDAARELMLAIIASGLHQKVQWRCATRVNCVTRDLLRLMKQAGCHKVSYGVESGSPEILKTVMKGTRLEHAEQACLMAKEEGIIVETNFMVGNPGETQQTINDTKAFIQKVKPHEFNVSNALYLFPGTPSYSMALRRNLISDDIWLTDVQTVAYTAENSQQQLSAWQLEIIRECGRQIGFLNTVRYFIYVLRRVSFKRILKAIWQNTISIGKRLKSGQSVQSTKPVSLETVRQILKEESLKSRKPGQLQPLRPVKKLEGMALERFN